MAEPTNEPTRKNPAPDAAALDQSLVDAMLEGAAAVEALPSSEPAGDDAPFDQDDLDALTDAAEAGTTATEPGATPSPPSAGTVPDAEPPTRSQAHVDVAEPGGQPVSLTDFEVPAGLDIEPKRVTMLGDINLPVKIELGRTVMKVEDVLQLGEGSVVELDKLAGDPVDVYVNSRLVARGEVLVLNDNFCVRIGEVITNDPHRVSA